MRSGLYHKHLINKMDVTILTISLRPIFTVTLVWNTKKLVTCKYKTNDFFHNFDLDNHLNLVKPKEGLSWFQERFMNNEDPTKCLNCPHTSENSDHMIVHLAWTHQKLREFLTPGKIFHQVLLSTHNMFVPAIKQIT